MRGRACLPLSPIRRFEKPPCRGTPHPLATAAAARITINAQMQPSSAAGRRHFTLFGLGMSPSKSKKSQATVAAVAADTCPRCGAALAEPGATLICPQCRAILLPAHRQAVRVGLIAQVAGAIAVILSAVLLFFSGGAIHSSFSLAAAVVAVLLLGGLGGLFGAWWAGRVFQQVTDRDSPEARALLGQVDKVSWVALASCGLTIVPLGIWFGVAPGQVKPAARESVRRTAREIQPCGG